MQITSTSYDLYHTQTSRVRYDLRIRCRTSARGQPLDLSEPPDVLRPPSPQSLMNDTQASVRESNGSASRDMTSNKSMEKGPENNNRTNGPKQSTPQKATSAGNGDSTGKTSSKKRRKVNHGMSKQATRDYLAN